MGTGGGTIVEDTPPVPWRAGCEASLSGLASVFVAYAFSRRGGRGLPGPKIRTLRQAQCRLWGSRHPACFHVSSHPPFARKKRRVRHPAVRLTDLWIVEVRGLPDSENPDLGHPHFLLVEMWATRGKLDRDGDLRGEAASVRSGDGFCPAFLCGQRTHGDAGLQMQAIRIAQ